MRASAERSMGVDDALSHILGVYKENKFEASFVMGGTKSIPVCRVTVNGPTGLPIAHALGKGHGKQCTASGLYEAWQHLQHEIGQRRLATELDRVKTLPIETVIDQEALRDETMLRRLKRDFPNVAVACMQFLPLGEMSQPVWYPAFVKSPSYRWYPVPGDNLSYLPYLRYAYDSGTATGVTTIDAALHAILEVVERDALSIAMLEWYVIKAPHVKALDPDTLPDDLRNLVGLAGDIIGATPLLLDIATDLGIPAFAALPSRPLEFSGLLGSGASLDPGYAVERAITELVQGHFLAKIRPSRGHQKRLNELQRWPALRNCATLDPTPLLGRISYHPFPANIVAGDIDVPNQVRSISAALRRSGFEALTYHWNREDTTCPVVTVLVPGLDTFAMVHNAVPVLPTGRAERWLFRSQAGDQRP